MPNYGTKRYGPMKGASKGKGKKQATSKKAKSKKAKSS